MRSNELRIGNLIQKNGKIHYTNIFTLRDIKNLSIDDTDIFEPIPLTEEILLKCGFEKVAGFYSSKDEILELTCDFIVWKPNTKKLEIKYLHQLQNLYFALTGEELEINL